MPNPIELHALTEAERQLFVLASAYRPMTGGIDWPWEVSELLRTISGLRNEIELLGSPSTVHRNFTDKVAGLESALKNSTADTVSMTKALSDAVEKADAEMLRVKACEHIALGDEGWETLRNECPSTAAVAFLRDAYEAGISVRKVIAEQLAVAHDALQKLHSAVDRAMGDSELPNDDSELMAAMQQAAALLPTPR